MNSEEPEYYAHVPPERVVMQGGGAGQMVLFPVILRGERTSLCIIERPMKCETCKPVKDWRCTCCGTVPDLTDPKGTRTWAPHSAGGKVVLCGSCVVYHMVGLVCPHQQPGAVTA